jgi:hypothetical protein
MASGEERMMILRMVEEGKITPEEGARLLAALGERQGEPEMAGAGAGDAASQGDGQGAPGSAQGDSAAYSPGWGGSYNQAFAGGSGAGSFSGRVFRVRVSNGMTGKQKVDVNIPLGLVDFGLRFIPKSANVDVQSIRDAIHTGMRGRIVDVQDSEKGEHVEIFIE